MHSFKLNVASLITQQLRVVHAAADSMSPLEKLSNFTEIANARASRPTNSAATLYDRLRSLTDDVGGYVPVAKRLGRNVRSSTASFGVAVNRVSLAG